VAQKLSTTHGISPAAATLTGVAIWIDEPSWPAHGRLWSHLISDTSLAELHDFAHRAGIPDRSFEGDHYDVPAERHTDVVRAGATPTGGSDLARRLRDSGLRFRKRRGERPLGRYADALVAVGGPHQLDLIASPLEPPERSGASVVLVTDGSHLVLVRNLSRPGWAPPGGKRDAGEALRVSAVREVAEETGLLVDPADLLPVGYERITIAPGDQVPPWDAGDNHIAVFATRVAQRAPVAPTAADDDVMEAQWVTLAEVANRCGAQPWWPLVEHFLRSVQR